jgi:DHA1 family bicyclomycin/chloramphenicol resistance-like MFS transporter
MLAGVSAAAFLGPFTQTVYTPSLVDVGRFFQVGPLLVNLTISLFTAILAVSNFLAGPFADSHGRRLTLLLGMAAYSIGSAICLLSGAYWLFLTGRAVQAFGISAAGVVAAAFIGDAYPPNERASAMGVYQTLSFLGPVFGPVVGGLVAAHLHWQWAFAMLTVGGLLVLAYNGLLLKETLSTDPGRSRPNLGSFGRILRNRSARSILLVGFSQFYGYYIFLVFLPGLLSTRFDLTIAQRGFFFVPLTAGILAGITGARWWLSHWTRTRTVTAASYGIAAVVLTLWLLLTGGLITPVLLASVLLAYGVLLGISLPAQTTILVNLFTTERATAMGVYNFTRFTGAASGPLLGVPIAAVAGDGGVFLSLAAALLLAAGAIQRSLYDPFEAATDQGSEDYRRETKK